MFMTLAHGRVNDHMKKLQPGSGRLCPQTRSRHPGSVGPDRNRRKGDQPVWRPETEGQFGQSSIQQQGHLPLGRSAVSC